MKEPESNMSRVVRWEVLPGLPGEGPIPMHFHLGQQTPWREGFVVRFWNADGSEWIGNFQGTGIGQTEVIDWPEASAVAVIAGKNFYLVAVRNLAEYCTLGPRSMVSGATFNEDRTTLFVADSYSILAFGTDRRIRWKSNAPGGLVVSMTGCKNGELLIYIDPETGQAGETVWLSAEDGTYLHIEYPAFILYLKPWQAIANESGSEKFYEDELSRELPLDHPLQGRPASPIAKSRACDDVLFRLENGTYAEVHLTFTKTPPERTGWPRFKLFGTLAEWMVGSMVPVHVEQFDLEE
jgi:hypothetical protein